MMKNKVIAGIASLLLIALVIVIVKAYGIARFEESWPADGLYFLQADSYLGYYSDETIEAEIPVLEIQYRDQADLWQNYIRYTMVSNAGEIDASFLRATPNIMDKNKYALGLLELKLDGLAPGSYDFTQIKLTDKQNKVTTYYIGHCTVAVREGTNPTDMQIRSSMVMTSAFSIYDVGLENTSKSTVEVEGLHYGFKYNTYDVKQQAGTNDMKYLTADNSIKPQKQKEYTFTFTKTSEVCVSKYVDAIKTFKPFLKYKKDGKEYMMSLNSALYITDLNDEDIKAIAKSLKSGAKS